MRNNNIKGLKLNFSNILLVILIFVITFSALLNLYEKKDKILKFLGFKLNIASLGDIYSYKPKKDDIYWANEIINGGYILHFRHAERDKWIDVTMYDLLESDLHDNGLDSTRYAESDYFSEAVCLNKRGEVQAQAMGEHISNIGLPIGLVVTSVSCRSRQTADLAFGGYNSMHRILVHTGPYNEDPKNRINNLKIFYNNLKIIDGKNTIVSAHNSVIECEIFINSCSKKLDLEEGGFYVISKRQEGLFLEHEFHNFQKFAQIFYKR